jgi:cell division FtsZ-interacting protein ZapD
VAAGMVARRVVASYIPGHSSMNSLKKTLMQRGMKLMSDPRILKLMQDERVMKAVMTAMSVPGRAQSLAREQLESIAKSMALATESEVKDLRRTVRKLQEEMSRMKVDQAAEKGPAKKKINAAE